MKKKTKESWKKKESNFRKKMKKGESWKKNEKKYKKKKYTIDYCYNSQCF